MQFIIFPCGVVLQTGIVLRCQILPMLSVLDSPILLTPPHKGFLKNAVNLSDSDTTDGESTKCKIARVLATLGRGGGEAGL